jgi:Tfp pilus assembly protein FimT
MARQLPCRGFSLIETVVLVAAVAVLVGVALPSFTGALQTRRMSAATRKLAGDLRSIQSTAVARGGLYRLHSGADPAVNQPGQYRLEQSSDGGTTWTGITLWTNVSTEFPGVSLTSIRDSAGAPVTLYEVRFNSRGATANPGGPSYPLNIVISGLAGSQTIQVRWTGSVRVP